MPTGLARLPAAQLVSADCISTMVHHAISFDGLASVAALLRLPGAKQIASKQLCEMILVSAKAGKQDVVDQLGRWDPCYVSVSPCRCSGTAVSASA